MAADLPTAAAVTSGTVTNAEQKINLTALLNFLLGYLGVKFGIGPQTVASAATLNLEAVTDTRDLVISGTTAIAAVTIEAGKVFRCRASGAFTLTNNAAIVTNTSANIVCKSGDSFVLRATAANTVEVLNYTRALSEAIGVAQTWQNLTASRASATPYTNDTGKTIQVTITSTISAAGNVSVLTMSPGVAVWGSINPTNNTGSYLSALIPDGVTYTLTTTAGTISIDRWTELRS